MKIPTTHIFHHNDNDGRLAAWLMSTHGVSHSQGPRIFREIDYTKVLTFEGVTRGDKVFIVDYSVLPEEMRKLLGLVNIEDIVWIDHHKTTIERYDEVKDFEPDKIPGIRSTRWAGCMLTYLYLNKLNPSPANALGAPLVVRFVDDWDCWKHEIPGSRAFNAGTKIHPTDPQTPFWKVCLTDDAFVERVIAEGRIICDYEKKRGMDYLERYGYECFIGDSLVAVMNQGMVNSDWFGVFTDQYDVVASYVFNGEKYLVSLYSLTTDVSQIAKARGGGGHKGAAGYFTTEHPFPDALKIGLVEAIGDALYEGEPEEDSGGDEDGDPPVGDI